jgi:hypothetical protein
VSTQRNDDCLLTNIENFDDINFRKHFVKIRVAFLTTKKVSPDMKRRYELQTMQYILFYTRIHFLNLSFFTMLYLRKTLQISYLIFIIFQMNTFNTTTERNIIVPLFC